MDQNRSSVNFAMLLRRLRNRGKEHIGRSFTI